MFTNFFIFLYNYFKTRRLFFYAVVIGLFLMAGFFASRIKFEENIAKLLPTDEKAETINKVLENANFSDKIVIHLYAKDSSQQEYLKKYAEYLERDILVKDQSKIANFQAKIKDESLMKILDVVGDNLPVFLDSSDFAIINKKITKDSLAQKVTDFYNSLNNPSSIITTDFYRDDPLGLKFMALKKWQSMQFQGEMVLNDGYLIHKNKKDLLCFITTKANPNDTAENEQLVDDLDAEIQKLNQQFAGKVTGEYFGSAPIALANARQIKSDITLTLSIALVLLYALYFYFYKKWIIPFLILIPGVLGSLCGMAVLYFLKGTISAVSIGIGSVLLGITLDYSLHILSHYRESGDIKKLYLDIVRPLLMCAAFTAVDFLCLLFLKSEVLKDLGIFAAVSVLVAAVFSLFFFPQVYQPKNNSSSHENSTWIDKLANYDMSQNKYLIIFCLLLIGICAFTFNRVKFNNDLAKLNFQPEKFIQTEKHLDALNHFSDKSVYLLSYGTNESDVLQTNFNLYQQLNQDQKKYQISGISSIANILLPIEVQHKRIDAWHQFWDKEKVGFLKENLIESGKKYGFKSNTFEPFYASLNKAYSPLKMKDFMAFKNLVLNDFISNKSGLTVVTTLVKIKNQQSEEFIQSLSKNKNVLVVDRKHLQETFLHHLENDFNKLLWISTIVVFVFVYLYFGDFLLTVLTNIPILLGWMVTTGVMGLFGLEFNAFNTIITTLIFGLGIDYSIFITKGLQDQFTYGKTDMPAYRAGIIMSALTTLLCFGILVFAKHSAILSIAFIPIIGIFSVVLMALTIQPLLFRIFIENPAKKGNAPVKILNLILSVFTFGYFLLMCLALSLVFGAIVPLFQVSKKKKDAWFDKSYRKVFSSLVIYAPRIKTKIYGKENLYADGPKIFISNHSSQLDTLLNGIFAEKLIFMVNERIANNKFYGKVIKQVGFYQISNDLEFEAKKLNEEFKLGKSIVIYPEGTRSENGAIRRFHKGAFYLAQTLDVPIQPILIHGNSDVLPKNDPILNPGRIDMYILPVIGNSDFSWGKTYSERAKKINQYFRSELRKVKNDLESAAYFKTKVFNNFTYKDQKIIKLAQKEWLINANFYYDLARNIPLNSRILHFGCQLALLDLILVYDDPNRKILGIDSDENASISNQFLDCVRYDLKFQNKSDEINNQNFDVLILNEQDLENRFNFDDFACVVIKSNDEIVWPNQFKETYNQNGWKIAQKI